MELEQSRALREAVEWLVCGWAWFRASSIFRPALPTILIERGALQPETYCLLADVARVD